ncbi:MAG: hypothetical protein WBL84_12435, partial [Xanthobacteraceae bacterium]
DHVSEYPISAVAMGTGLNLQCQPAAVAVNTYTCGPAPHIRQPVSQRAHSSSLLAIHFCSTNQLTVFC